MGLPEPPLSRAALVLIFASLSLRFSMLLLIITNSPGSLARKKELMFYSRGFKGASSREPRSIALKTAGEKLAFLLLPRRMKMKRLFGAGTPVLMAGFFWPDSS
jgi:hypothetical protein